MLRKTMIVLMAGAALTGGLTADGFARGGGGGGGGGHRGGFGGGHAGGFGSGAHIGSLGGGHFGGAGAAFARGVAGQHFAVTGDHLGHEGHFGRGRRFVPGVHGYDYGCSYAYSYHTPYDSCYPPAY